MSVSYSDLTPRQHRSLEIIAIFVLCVTHILTCLNAAGIVRFFPDPWMDFDMFYVVGLLAQDGLGFQAYDVERMHEHQLELDGVPEAMTWNYPPTFNGVVAGFALFPRELARFIFGLSGVAILVLGMRRLAGDSAGLALFAVLPAAAACVRSGQTSLIMAGCLAFAAAFSVENLSRRAGAVASLVAMKPHLGIGVGAAWLIGGHWRTLATGAILATAVAATSVFAFGLEQWRAFLLAFGNTFDKLGGGEHELHRLVSLHATALGLGASETLAWTVQILGAITALAITGWASLMLGTRSALGVGLLSTPLVSPYLYDYDLTILAPAFALIFPAIADTGRRVPWILLAALVWVASGWGTVASSFLDASDGATATASPAGLALLACLLIVARTLKSSGTDRRRARRQLP